MTPARFSDVALSLKGATFDHKWGGVRVFSVGGKIFAHAGVAGDETPLFAFKVSPIAYDLLLEGGEAEPAPYFARLGWVRLTAHDALHDDVLERYIALAHGLAAAKLTRKARAALGLDEHAAP
jgi:predicted DNA-binding protein (MmcQ/YjbR family)